MASQPEWEHSLCGCFDNCGVCVITYFIPCYTAGKVAEKVGESCCACGLVVCFPLAGCICRAIIRGKVREQKSLPGSMIGDLIKVGCCPLCTLVQEAQEVKAIGSQSMARGDLVIERA